MDSNYQSFTVADDKVIQLHCENVSWEKATDKIPAEVAS